MRRLIDRTIGITELHHFVKLTQDSQKDIAVWLTFLSSFNGKAFEDQVSSESLQMHTDAAGSLGYGACFQNKWFYGRFPEAWNKANITFLEFFPNSACPRNMGTLVEESFNSVLHR